MAHLPRSSSSPQPYATSSYFSPSSRGCGLALSSEMDFERLNFAFNEQAFNDINYSALAMTFAEGEQDCGELIVGNQPQYPTQPPIHESFGNPSDFVQSMPQSFLQEFHYPTNGVDENIAVNVQPPNIANFPMQTSSGQHSADPQDYFIPPPHANFFSNQEPLSLGLPTPLPSPTYLHPSAPSVMALEGTPAARQAHAYHTEIPYHPYTIVGPSTDTFEHFPVNALLPLSPQGLHLAGQDTMQMPMQDTFLGAPAHPQDHFDQELTGAGSPKATRRGRGRKSTRKQVPNSRYVPYPTPPLEAPRSPDGASSSQTMGQASSGSNTRRAKGHRKAPTPRELPQNTVAISCMLGNCTAIRQGLDDLKSHLASDIHGLDKSKGNKARRACDVCHKDLAKSAYVQHLLSLHTPVTLQCREGSCQRRCARYDTLRAHFNEDHDHKPPCYDEVYLS